MNNRVLLLFAVLFCTTSCLVLEIQFMMQCVAHRNAWIYNGYGCWCGIGGAGPTVDGIDGCCKAHDICYDNLYKKHVCWQAPFEYFPIYTWKCVNNTVECTGLTPFGVQVANECGEQLCECDRILTACWAKYREPN
ncbi:unnamed protein product [Caenorhabditis bovis]|uniref:Phospholipase A2 n=1 Tax=Caenorhabditis bovis TaxID=2654633 RepID=A0A8S1F2I3_9PELO|nr:unnamed protein product [Caenorhabditis bovis]